MRIMKKIIICIMVMLGVTSSAQVKKQVDSIDVVTGEIFPTEHYIEVDTVSCDSLFHQEASIPQIPLELLDSMLISNFDDRYAVVYKGGKCGIYDRQKEENVTRIEYTALWFSLRKEVEGEYYTYFGWDEPETMGVIGIAEVNNQFMTIAMPKNDDDINEE